MTENDINDDKLQLPDGIGIKWKELARVLGYRNAIIEAIEKERGSSTKECCIDLLIRWIGREGSEATAGRLADALEKIERKNLADNLIRGKQERNGYRQLSKFLRVIKRVFKNDSKPCKLTKAIQRH